MWMSQNLQELRDGMVWLERACISSVCRLGEEPRVEAVSIYTHVASKEETATSTKPSRNRPSGDGERLSGNSPIATEEAVKDGGVLGNHAVASEPSAGSESVAA